MNMVIFNRFLYVFQRFLPLDSCSFGILMYPKDGATLVNKENHRKTIGQPLENDAFMGFWMGFYGIHPSGNLLHSYVTVLPLKKVIFRSYVKLPEG